MQFVKWSHVSVWRVEVSASESEILQVSFIYFKKEAEIVWKLVAIFLLREFLWTRRNKRKLYLK